jgi:serine/threonine-protein kinase
MERIGRYRIVRELGHGAMGVVYHAIDPNIGRPVAIKTIRLGEVSNAQERARLRERLFREARSAGMLSHPGIVTIYDVEQQGDLAYIAMEFVDGPTLDEVLSGPAPIPPERMFSILGQASVALDYAHQKGIVHRDIKPANIMIAGDGTARITDFGIAKVTASEQFTMTGTIIGTPHYMAPEQVQGLAVDGRADQFSLAVMAFEMLTGEKPFTGEQLTTVVYKIVAEEPPAAQRLNASLSAQIEGVLRKALAKKPDGRYRTCQEFIDALEAACAATRGWKPLARGGGLNEPTFAGESRPPLPPPISRRARRDSTTEYRERRRTGVLPVLLAILMAAGLVGLIAWQAAPWIAGRSATPEAEIPAPPLPPAPRAQTEPLEIPKPSALSPPPATERAQAAPAKPEEEEAAPPPAPPAAQAPPVAAKPAPRPFQVLIPTDPPGATAVLDGRPDASCRTPCTLEALPGSHRISVAMPGFQGEYRNFDVRGAPQELPLVALSKAGGTLMLTTVPPGAAISVDGRNLNQSTPAQISLAPGTYTVVVEKNGRRASERVEIRNGGTTFRKIPLDQ